MLTKIKPVYNKNSEIYYDNIENINIKKEREIKRIQNEIEKNIDNELDKITKPKEPEIKWPDHSPGCLMILMGIFSFSFLFSAAEEVITAIIVVGLTLLIIGVFLLKENDKKIDKNKEIEKEYQNCLTKYNEEVLICKNNLTEKYNNLTKDKIKEIEDKYNLEIEEKAITKTKKEEIITSLIDKNKELINQIQNNIKLVNTKLEELYSIDIIFEKYRNLTAISMFYEYFVSSRVFELEGKDGAYNLFETEIRQNIIIVKLNDICEHLEDIKQNQYCMYKELVNINESLDTLNSYTFVMGIYLNKINNNVLDIKEIDQYILNCSNEINKNINTIKNITIADFLIK